MSDTTDSELAQNFGQKVVETAVDILEKLERYGWHESCLAKCLKEGHWDKVERLIIKLSAAYVQENRDVMLAELFVEAWRQYKEDGVLPEDDLQRMYNQHQWQETLTYINYLWSQLTISRETVAGLEWPPPRTS